MKLSIKEIVETGQRQRPEVETSLIDRSFRRISRYFTWFFLRLGCTPNQVTVCSMVLAAAGGAFLLLLGTQGFSLAGICWLGFYALDYSDGEVARCLKKQTMSGNYLDYFGHYIIFIGIFLGFSNIALLHFSPNVVLPVGLLGMAGIFLRGLAGSLLWEVACNENLRMTKRLATANTEVVYNFEVGAQLAHAADDDDQGSSAAGTPKNKLSKRLFRIVVSPSGGDLIILAAIAVCFLEAVIQTAALSDRGFAWFAWLFFFYISVANIILGVGLIYRNVRSRRVESVFQRLFRDNDSRFSL